MSATPPFSDAEFRERRDRVRAALSERGLDAILITSPENIYYLVGLDHMGYFAYQMLVLPAKGEPVLITRAMEHAVVRDQVPGIHHVGYPDGSAADRAPAGGPPPAKGAETLEPWPAPGRAAVDEAPPSVRCTCDVVSELGLAEGVLGMEKSGSFFPAALAEGIQAGLPGAVFHEASGLVDGFRIRQSPAELACTREAARVSDAMMLTAIASAGLGVHKRDVMGATYNEMCRRGGTYPGFVPLVRATTTLDHEHGTWQDYVLGDGDLLFLEMAGCVRRYHAPMGRLVFLGDAPDEAVRANDICREAAHAAADTIRPEVQAGDVYAAWQGVLDRHGVDYRRHHCGYSVGIGYPPSWSGSGVPVGLRAGSEMRLEAGMVFHLMSWLLRSPLGDAFLSDTVVVTEDGCEFLTTVPADLTVRR
ncbi:Xaa-Pro aminopeptidase [Salinisphaera sp. PC39]|uniref:M24 family metallopeptidase n=1 Tax=Salinisphaera sp. PC39 TaxID=1304156 RepID=UPI0033411A62